MGGFFPRQLASLDLTSLEHETVICMAGTTRPVWQMTTNLNPNRFAVASVFDSNPVRCRPWRSYRNRSYERSTCITVDKLTTFNGLSIFREVVNGQTTMACKTRVPSGSTFAHEY